jgi:hypothetical protein
VTVLEMVDLMVRLKVESLDASMDSKKVDLKVWLLVSRKVEQVAALTVYMSECVKELKQVVY